MTPIPPVLQASSSSFPLKISTGRSLNHFVYASLLFKTQHLEFSFRNKWFNIECFITVESPLNRHHLFLRVRKRIEDALQNDISLQRLKSAAEKIASLVNQEIQNIRVLIISLEPSRFTICTASKGEAASSAYILTKDSINELKEEEPIEIKPENPFFLMLASRESALKIARSLLGIYQENGDQPPSFFLKKIGGDLREESSICLIQPPEEISEKVSMQLANERQGRGWHYSWPMSPTRKYSTSFLDAISLDTKVVCTKLQLEGSIFLAIFEKKEEINEEAIESIIRSCFQKKRASLKKGSEEESFSHLFALILKMVVDALKIERVALVLIHPSFILSTNHAYHPPASRIYLFKPALNQRKCFEMMRGSDDDPSYLKEYSQPSGQPFFTFTNQPGLKVVILSGLLTPTVSGSQIQSTLSLDNRVKERLEAVCPPEGAALLYDTSEKTIETIPNQDFT